MICYRDMSFCQSDCTNQDCFWFISSAVVEGSEKTGLPLSVSDFSETCPEYKPKTSDELTREELLQMVAKQMETIHWLRTEIEGMANSVNNEAPDLARRKWKAGQAAERERIKEIVAEVAWQGNHDKWFDCADAIAARIEE